MAQEDEYIDSLISDVLSSPGYKDLSEEKKLSIKEKLEDHFQSLVIDTTLNRLTKDQMQELKKVMEEDESKMEEKMEEFASTIPLLAADIESRLDQEVEALKRLEGGSDQE